ncbi:MAG: hypothetical protein Q7T73_06800 [Beijerinckiaceae bacterium]|nr:hypothetical protein [Beijerinckiaceae bacterium]
MTTTEAKTKRKRLEINAATVKEALRLAAESTNSKQIQDFFDTRQLYLQLRQRGKRVSWFMRARGRSQLLGTAVLERGVVSGDYLTITAARDKAALIFAGLDPTPVPVPRKKEGDEEVATAWTWADLDREYQASLTVQRWVSGSKTKPPNRGTQDDVRLALSKPPLVTLGPKRLTDLKPRDLIMAIEEVHQVSGHRQCAKCLTYVKSALSWALSDKMIAAGLEDVLPWWAALKPPKPTAPEMKAMKERSEKLVQAKTDFTIGHLAELLVIHESFCAGKVGNEKVSPGIRWGLWWLAFTANRRFSTTVLERARLRQVDEFGLPGWGRAEWPAEAMKAKSEFWLPIPPEALHVANSCMSDWKALVTKSTSQYETTRWVFASTRRVGRDPDNRDVSIYPNSLNHHLRNLRGDKGVDDTDLLRHLPAFWLHLVRSVSANYLETRSDVPPAAASLMLAHTLPADKDKAAPTTQKFYLTGQRMDQKLIAMKAWSEALMAAYYEAGGVYPQPSEEGLPVAQAAE